MREPSASKPARSANSENKLSPWRGLRPRPLRAETVSRISRRSVQGTSFSAERIFAMSTCPVTCAPMGRRISVSRVRAFRRSSSRPPRGLSFFTSARRPAQLAAGPRFAAARLPSAIAPEAVWSLVVTRLGVDSSSRLRFQRAGTMGECATLLAGGRSRPNVASIWFASSALRHRALRCATPRFRFRGWEPLTEREIENKGTRAKLQFPLHEAETPETLSLPPNGSAKAP